MGTLKSTVITTMYLLSKFYWRLYWCFQVCCTPSGFCIYSQATLESTWWVPHFFSLQSLQYFCCPVASVELWADNTKVSTLNYVIRVHVCLAHSTMSFLRVRNCVLFTFVSIPHSAVAKYVVNSANICWIQYALNT